MGNNVQIPSLISGEEYMEQCHTDTLKATLLKSSFLLLTGA